MENHNSPVAIFYSNMYLVVYYWASFISFLYHNIMAGVVLSGITRFCVKLSRCRFVLPFSSMILFSVCLHSVCWVTLLCQNWLDITSKYFDNKCFKRSDAFKLILDFWYLLNSILKLLRNTINSTTYFLLLSLISKAVLKHATYV